MSTNDASLAEEDQAIAAQLTALVLAGKDRKSYALLRSLSSDQRCRIVEKYFLPRLTNNIGRQARPDPKG